MDRIAALLADLAHDDHATRVTAYFALNDAGVNPIEAARTIGKGKDQRARINAASVLLVMGMDIGEALQTLTAALKSDDAGLRYRAAFGLAIVGFVSDDTIAVLSEGLKNPKAEVRENAAVSLARLAWQPEIGKAKPYLTQALIDASPLVRRHAVYALSLRGDAVLTELARWLKDDSADVRQQVLMLLHQQFDREALPFLRDAVNDRDANVRWAAVFYLGRSGAAARDALKEAAKHSDPAVRQQAEKSLHALDKK